jgi:hypothetical protein
MAFDKGEFQNFPLSRAAKTAYRKVVGMEQGKKMLLPCSLRLAAQETRYSKTCTFQPSVKSGHHYYSETCEIRASLG